MRVFCRAKVKHRRRGICTGRPFGPDWFTVLQQSIDVERDFIVRFRDAQVILLEIPQVRRPGCQKSPLNVDLSSFQARCQKTQVFIETQVFRTLRAKAVALGPEWAGLTGRTSL
jgi:hypothetical protein